MKTRVYRNLNNGLWSLKQRIAGKWVVVGHCSACVIDGAEPFVSVKSRARCVAKGQREVHAWIEGDLCRMPSGFVSFQNRHPEHRGFAADLIPYYDEGAPVTYHPYELDHFFFVHHGAQYYGSDFAMFGADQKVRVS
jgi:hypothetical protein